MGDIQSARPYCAAYVLLRRKQKYLFVLRQNTSWMNGFYGLPSGKVEPNEGFLRAAIREAQEEVGIAIRPDQLSHAVTLWRLTEDETEWCTVAFYAHSWEGEPYNAEPHIHSEIAWFGSDELPVNVIPSVRRIIELHESGQTYGEYGG